MLILTPSRKLIHFSGGSMDPLNHLLSEEMNYTVEHIKEVRESFGPYKYRILRNGEEVAVFLHNYRGECEWIKTTDGHEESPPFGPCSDFLTGGGPLPTGLTKKAEEYLDSMLSKE